MTLERDWKGEAHRFSRGLQYQYQKILVSPEGIRMFKGDAASYRRFVDELHSHIKWCNASLKKEPVSVEKIELGKVTNSEKIGFRIYVKIFGTSSHFDDSYDLLNQRFETNPRLFYANYATSQFHAQFLSNVQPDRDDFFHHVQKILYKRLQVQSIWYHDMVARVRILIVEQKREAYYNALKHMNKDEALCAIEGAIIAKGIQLEELQEVFTRAAVHTTHGA